MTDLQAILAASAKRHSHLCPRQVLGARAALAAGEILNVALPVHSKKLLVISETDGCFVDGLELATGVSVGHRTLRIEDFGKVAATFVNLEDARTVRLVAMTESRQRARAWAAAEEPALNDYDAQLWGYQQLPVSDLFKIETVVLQPSLEAIVSQPGLRTCCEQCGEDIINEREVHLQGRVLCRACAGHSYYKLQPE